ncbi:MAG TPA: cyclic pyranopterin monophosphate synthase MoaC [Blastocatellia bacterium]|jgi:cyclic pyranopterin phosphate synthase|nr:cyclic pyranopterin monophosphate synthase MoaC [Blastocatellia bacterium]
MSLTHIDEQGHARMVDVSSKPVTSRTAVASGFVKMSAQTVEAIKTKTAPKGDPLEPARLAGIMAAKRTAEIIPLCHVLPLSHVDIELVLTTDGIAIKSTVTAEAKTGVEMEALVAVSATALTIYDMCKAIDKGMVITEVRLELKTGGKSGTYERR